MISSKKFKERARRAGADLVGIASMDRFEGAPKEMDPRQIFPEAKAAVVFGFRIPRGCFRGIEEGTYFNAYPSMGYANINLVAAPIVLRETSLFLEDEGYEAVPIQNMCFYTTAEPHTGEIRRGKRMRSVSVAPGRPAPDILVSFRFAAVAAGLGEIGYSKVFLSPEYGPRQRLAMLLTDAPLEPDPIFEEKICDRCLLCVKECSGNAISRTETIKMNLAGKNLEWGKLDHVRCSSAYTGGKRETNPFFPPGADEEKLLSHLYGEGQKDEENLVKIMPYTYASLWNFHHNSAVEGARGCIRACMIHLEETGRIKASFKEPFRKRKPWALK